MKPLAIRAAAISVVMVGTVVMSGSASMATGSVPYTDFASAGSIGLCDKAGHAVTSGRITDRPFVWRAVSSMKAPAGYDGPGRKATLIIYQPRPQSYPNQWSGDNMTSGSSYTSPDVPMAAATDIDFTLKEFLGEFKPLLNGFLQLRMYFGAPGKTTYTDTYPTTDIQVTGDTWHVVRGASLPCDKGTATANEQSAFLATKPKPTPTASGGATTSPGSATPTATATSPSGAGTIVPSPSASGGPDGSNAAGGTSTAGGVAAAASTGGGGKAAALLGVLAIVTVVGGGAWWYRRQQHAGSSRTSS